MRKNVAVIGLGFGDEGKGLVTNWLAQSKDFNYVTRFSGGHQVGHTVMLSDGPHVFQNFGSGTAANLSTLWEKDCCIDPMKIEVEMEILLEHEITPFLAIHPMCPVTTPFEVALNEKRANNNSVGAGIAETFIRESKGCHFYAKDLDSPILEGKLEGLRNFYADNSVNLQPFIDSIEYIKSKFSITIEDYEIFSRTKGSILEGSQGLLLDEKIGFYPNVTWGNLIPDVKEVYAVTRAYKTIHSNGYFADKKINDHIHLPDTETNQPNPFQGTFRYDILDVDLLEYSLSYIRHIETINLVVTCIDHLSEYKFFHDGEVKTFNTYPEFLNELRRLLGLVNVYYSYSPYSQKIKKLDV